MNRKIKIGIIIGLLFILIFFPIIKEGFTSCTQANANCNTCTTAAINGTSSGCYWNPYDNSCGSFNDAGYYKSCSAIPDPLPPNPNKPTDPNNVNNYNPINKRILHRIQN
jgi:hypothetical protein